MKVMVVMVNGLCVAAVRTQGSQRVWSSSSAGGGMCSDSESAGGSSESRSMDSPTASPGTFSNIIYKSVLVMYVRHLKV